MMYQCIIAYLALKRISCINYYYFFIFYFICPHKGKEERKFELIIFALSVFMRRGLQPIELLLTNNIIH
jgi:hypothetical protein